MTRRDKILVGAALALVAVAGPTVEANATPSPDPAPPGYGAMPPAMTRASQTWAASVDPLIWHDNPRAEATGWGCDWQSTRPRTLACSHARYMPTRTRTITFSVVWRPFLACRERISGDDYTGQTPSSDGGCITWRRTDR